MTRSRKARRAEERAADKRLRKLLARIQVGEATEAEQLEAAELGEADLCATGTKAAHVRFLTL